MAKCVHCGNSIALLENGVYVGCEHAPQASPDVLEMNAMFLASLFMENAAAKEKEPDGTPDN